MAKQNFHAQFQILGLEIRETMRSIYLPPIEFVSSEVDDLFKMLTDGDALLGDGTNFCQASFLDFVGVMPLFKGFTSSFGDISNNSLQMKINHLGKNCLIKIEFSLETI